MQNAHLYRRGVVLPLDDDAEERPRSNDVGASTNARVLRVADPAGFETLWRLGLFREINARCAALLDDYEEERIDPTSVGGVVAAVDVVAGNADAESPETVAFLGSLRKPALEASHSRRPLLFAL